MPSAHRYPATFGSESWTGQLGPQRIIDLSQRDAVSSLRPSSRSSAPKMRAVPDLRGRPYCLVVLASAPQDGRVDQGMSSDLAFHRGPGTAWHMLSPGFLDFFLIFPAQRYVKNLRKGLGSLLSVPFNSTVGFPSSCDIALRTVEIGVTRARTISRGSSKASARRAA